jgi:hypothetical protein
LWRARPGWFSGFDSNVGGVHPKVTKQVTTGLNTYDRVFSMTIIKKPEKAALLGESVLLTSFFILLIIALYSV